MHRVLKQLKQFWSNAIQQTINITKSLRPDKSYAYLLNIESSNIVFLKTYNIDFDKIIITLTDQNGRSLKTTGKVNLTLNLNKLK